MEYSKHVELKREKHGKFEGFAWFPEETPKLAPLILITWVVLSLLLVACSTTPQTGSLAPEPTKMLTQQGTTTPTSRPLGTATPEPSSTHLPKPTPIPTPDMGKIKNGIQQALDLYARAYTNNDLDLLAQAVDQAPPFWRFITTRFDNFQKSFAAGQTRFSYAVKDIKLRDYGFVEARITTIGGYETYWLFHEQDGKWLLAEPTADQIGEPKIIEYENFTFYTYAWADDTNAQVIQLMENARQRVLKVLGQVPDQKAVVRIKPIYAVSPFDDPFAVAYYDRGYRGQENNIDIFSPHSYGFGFYDPVVGWEEELESILTHEYTHMTHQRNFGNAGQTCAWMSEGLAEYVAGDYRTNEVRAAVRSGNIIPIVDTGTLVYKQDLNHLVLLKKDRELAYGFSVSLVIFVTKNYGGLDGFWKLARACDQTIDFDIALQQALGVTLDKFDKDWRAWLQKY
jgi:hypothetical protein